MKLSVIIVNYNTKNTTVNCINSCLKEGSNLSYEIIVIDNGSTDGSLKLFLTEYKKQKKVVIIDNHYNAGFSKGVNIGLQRSKGTYKYLLNSDTEVPEGVFGKIIKLAELNNNVGVIGTKLILPDKSVQKSCFNFPSIIGAFKEYWLGKSGTYSSFYTEKNSEVDAVVGASFLITPQAYERVGLFDEKYFMYFEDLDYCKRIIQAGLKVLYTPDIKINHHHGLSGDNKTDFANQWRRLVPSSKIYNGILKYYIISFVLWSGQKLKSIH